MERHGGQTNHHQIRSLLTCWSQRVAEVVKEESSDWR